MATNTQNAGISGRSGSKATIPVGRTAPRGPLRKLAVLHW